MENDGGNLFMGNPGHTGNNMLELELELNPTTSRFDWATNNHGHPNSFNFYATTTPTTTTTSGRTEIISSSSTLPQAHALMFLPHHQYYDNATLAHHLNQQHSLYTGNGYHMHPDPHLVCLNLGKRHYFEDSTDPTQLPGRFSIGKKGKPYCNNLGVGPSSSVASMDPPAAVPRCQVEGCHVALVKAKEYHRRHKVCEMHSKAPKVVVLGLEQRFCQQCSRFHVVSEFDDSKRSCRRRLAGHNERRRKTSHDSASRNSAQDNKLMTGSFSYLSSQTGRALSLLSSNANSWISPSDLSTRSSAALRELIAENRATIVARQLVLDQDRHLHHHAMEDPGEPQPGFSSIAVEQHSSVPWFPETGSQVTLDLMQASSSAFGMLSVRGKTKEEEEECSELWNSLEGIV
ncbi:hypothetical protein V6N13_045643 [Hibiscus sabdariffa]|uniref:SBP-type domain-containing protein n=1 Tax=Hibiscus sabdariffa TaxID=183260 RepID=A0ABR2RM37_9ROSI